VTYNTTDYRICLSRDQLVGLVDQLAVKYPRAFITEPARRLPLKKNIILDLEQDGVFDGATREAVVRYYQRNFGYEYSLLAGAKRIDLNGKEVGTVTEQEQSDSKARVQAQKRYMRETDQGRAKAMGPIEVARKLHAEGRISTDMLSKITAPPVSRPVPLIISNGVDHRPDDVAVTSVDLGPVRALWTTIDSLLSKAGGSNELHAAALRVFVLEAEKVIGALTAKKPLPSPQKALASPS
jgi:sRNA-binding protein